VKDGYRALVLKDGARVELRSRRDNDLTRTYPSVTGAAQRLLADSAIIDGEIVALDASGRPSFNGLQHRGALAGHRIVFYAFDLLHLNGTDLTSMPLDKRRERLIDAIAGSGLLLSVSLPGSPADIVKSVQALGLEGVVAKLRTSPYVPGERSSDWQKLKLQKQQEFVIGGYRPQDRSIEAVIVGYYENGKLRFAGRIRAGFVAHTRKELYRRLAPLHTDSCPFVDLPTKERSRWGGGVSAEDMKEMRWVEPDLVAQICFADWTPDGRLREAKFLGLRSDKDPGEVRRECK